MSAGAVVNQVDSYGETPLHFAIFNCSDPQVIEKLLPYFPDINMRDNDGHTPLWHALEWQEKETADLLRCHGGVV